MPSFVAGMPVFVVVLLCGLSAQLLKVLIYSFVQRELCLRVLGESIGMPSLHAATMTCLATLLALNLSWGASEAAIALVLAVIVIHDSVRLRGSAQRQKEVLCRLIREVPGGGRFRRRLLEILTARAHHPLHVAFGALFGLLFAIIFAMVPQ